MADKTYILAIDQGTTSTRAMVFDHGGGTADVLAGDADAAEDLVQAILASRKRV